MWASSRWGRVRRELSEIQRPCTHIWTRCITLRVTASQPSLAAMSTRALMENRQSRIYEQETDWALEGIVVTMSCVHLIVLL